ncbi:hypothetical protein TSOC_000490 [Tetrabaena socialis]|uniref:ATPase AAA-type core domain-containing protein n=1 Tax=Tetrabaena socialis TaxID=47790 RepID=A0A2J8AJ51_9CHLO|nr:hypothetical protein TSOC_000490 [Tetrabaena socialis]|eukprot:PNH12547.1 hypothetical protein TSOC_000490 [Tetrabaena socialis]
MKVLMPTSAHDAVMMWLWPVLAGWVLILLRWIPSLVFVQRIYKSNADLKLTMLVLDAINDIQPAMRFGEEVFRRHTVPRVMLSLRKQYFLQTKLCNVGIDGDLHLEVVVWRPFWIPALVPDAVPQKRLDPRHTLEVLTLINACMVTATEILMSDEVPPVARANAEAVAQMMHDHYSEKKQRSCVFVLHGYPGAGKSLAVRLLAKKLDADLFDAYHPAKRGISLSSILSDYSGHMDRLVIAYEEFDTSLKKVAAGDVFNDDKEERRRMCFDATDKSSWNTLIDMYKRRTNTIMVLTTNRSYDEVQEMIDVDRSMLRKGRVDFHIVFQLGADPVRMEAMTVDVPKKTMGTGCSVFDEWGSD